MSIFRYQDIMNAGEFSPSYYVSPNQEGRQLVIPDIHACPKTFRELVKKIELTVHDQLFLLGDYINKGPDNSGVIDFILELIENGFQLFPLRGNHEDMLLQSHRNSITADYGRIPRLQKRRGIVDANHRILPKYLSFFENLPYYYELDEFLIVHAGFNFKVENPFEDFETMLWMKEFEYDGTYKNKTIVIGHVSEMLQFIEEDVKNKKSLIHLDNGCVYKNKWFRGNLLCLDLQEFTLTAQANIDVEQVSSWV